MRRVELAPNVIDPRGGACCPRVQIESVGWFETLQLAASGRNEVHEVFTPGAAGWVRIDNGDE